MTKEEVKKMLGSLFMDSVKETGEVVRVFNDKCFDRERPERRLYEVVSAAMRDSDLSFEFSYAIAEKAADVLAELEDWENDDDDMMRELIDSAVPVYTYDLMKIYLSDSWAVDETIKELGDAGDSTKNAAMAWYRLIEKMAPHQSSIQSQPALPIYHPMRISNI